MQAIKTADEIKPMKITMIACSPYLRTVQTAETIAEKLGIDSTHIKIIDELRERGLGVLENKTKEHDGLWYFTDDDSNGIELRVDLFTRMNVCLSRLKELSEHEVLLVVGHAISGFYLMQAAANKASVDVFDSPALMSNADYIKVEFKRAPTVE